MYVRNYQPGSSWLPGEVQERTGPVSFRIKMQDGRIRRCHVNQVRKRSVEEPLAPEVQVEVPNSLTEVLPETPDPPVEFAQPSPEPCVSEPVVEENLPQPSESSTVSRPSTAVKVYPSRIRKTVD